MTAAYSLLEEEVTTPKRSLNRFWKFGIITLGSIAIISGLTAVIVLQTKKNGPINTKAPARFISFNVPTQEQTYYLDLDKYPIEDTLLELFAGSKSSIETVTTDNLLKNKDSTHWTDKWLVNTDSVEEDTLSCDKQLLPFPILRHIVSEYIPKKNPDNSYDVKSDIDFKKPFVVLPFAKQPKLIQGQKLCVRVIVPYQNKGENDTIQLLYRPYDHNNEKISSPWWDTMMTGLKNIDTNATLPIQMEPWSGHGPLRQKARVLNEVNLQIPEWTRLRDDELYERVRMHVYESTITLPQSGKYELSSLLEFVEGRYNFEYGPVTPYQPANLSIYPIGSDTILISETNKPTKESKDQNLHLSLLKQHLSLPLCNKLDHAGRWLSWPKINENQPANENNYANKEDLHKIAGLTRDGKYWAPYDCKYRHISYESFNRCTSKKYSRGIDLYGDSNIRRAIKKFLSHGQWCKGWEKHITSPLLPNDQVPLVDQSFIKRQQIEGYNHPQNYTYITESQTRNCYCEDFQEDYWNLEWFNPMARGFDLEFGNTLQQSEALGKTEWDDDNNNNVTTRDAIQVHSYKWDGLTYLNSPNWDTAVPSSVKPADVAIFSLGNWDGAFARLEPYLKDVDTLIRQIKEHYDLTKTRIIYRTAQYYCCRIDVSGRTRQVSGPRMEAFEQETIRRFKQELNASIWDTSTLGQSKSWDEKIISITCPSNHVPADQVEIENQVLMNGLCNNI